MPRFFFHLRGDGQNYEDRVGMQLPSLQEAEIVAVRAAGLILAQAPDDEEVFQRWFEVADADGNCLVLVPLRSILLLEAA